MCLTCSSLLTTKTHWDILTLNGAGIPTVQVKWEEMFGTKEAEEKENPKKSTEKRVVGKIGKRKIATKCLEWGTAIRALM